LLKALIIGLCLVLLTGCTALRLAYNNGPTLSWWWLDGYGDFTREQAPAIRQALDRLFAWHRQTQLPEVATFLAAAQADVIAPTTPEAACAWQDRAQALLAPVTERGIQEAADVLPLLGPQQLAHIEQRQAKARDEMRDEFLQPDPEDRLEASIDRAMERAERLYGRLDAPQRTVVAEGVKASPFDAVLWLRERERRQRDLLQVLRRLRTEGADRDTRVSALRALAERGDRSPVPAYRDYQARLRTYNCALAARLHNATTPEQRENARQTLQGWRDDVRALMQGPRLETAPRPDLAPV
jgi:hypothetical protein